MNGNGAWTSAPTVIIAAITTEPVDGLGWPLAIAIPDELLGHPAWIRTTHIHTITRTGLGQHAGCLPIAVIRRTDDALRRVLNLGHDR